jgi:hypothetical protein
MRRLLLVVTLVLTAALVASCSSNPSANNPQTKPTRAFTVYTPEGKVSVFLTGDLPAHWNSTFPLPQGATPAGSGVLENSKKKVQIGVFSTPTSPSSAFTFYRYSSFLSVTRSASVGVHDAFVGWLQTTGALPGVVAVLNKDAGTYVVALLVTPKPHGPTGVTGPLHGVTGVSGLTGGPSGTTAGFTGTSGVTGGPTGGSVGPTAVSGPTGVTGTPGVSGPSGLTGVPPTTRGTGGKKK